MIETKSLVDDLFHEEQEANSFDNLQVDVRQLYEQHPYDAKVAGSSSIRSPFRRLYSSMPIPVAQRNRLWHLISRLHLDSAWFFEFREYWSSVLGGRPLLSPEDFYFLKNLYRVKFQRNQIPDTTAADVHLEAWQQNELLYQLLHLVYRESLSNQLSLVNKVRKLKKGRIRSTLEFGCATAPVTTTYSDFFGLGGLQRAYIADIQTLAFHYAAYKFKDRANVTPVLLVPDNDFGLSLDQNVDAIFCITVFEHLNKPLDTIAAFHETLSPQGILAFDYIMGDGDGLDTHQAVRDRGSVLDFVTSNFDVLAGKINKSESMGLTIVQKR